MALWEIVNNRPYDIPNIKNDKGEEIDKPKNQDTSSNWEILTKNLKVKYILYCGLDANEYNQVSAYDTTKHI